MYYFYVFSTVHSLRHRHFNLWNVALSPRRQRLPPQPQFAAAVALFIAQFSWATDVSTVATTTRSWPTIQRKRYAWHRQRHCAGLSIAQFPIKMPKVFAKKTISFCRQMSNNSIVEMKELASRICRDYLHGAWKSVNADNIGLVHIRWVAFVCRAFQIGMFTPTFFAPLAWLLLRHRHTWPTWFISSSK